MVVAWLESQGPQWKAQVQVVATGRCSAYRAAVHQALPQALIVADYFHLVRLANQMVTEVRQRRSLGQAVPLKRLSAAVADIDAIRARRAERAGGVIAEYTVAA